MSYPRFSFDAEFLVDGDVREPVRAKKSFTPEEVEAARAEGYADGQRSALARAEAEVAAALSVLADAAHAGLGSLAALAHEHREGSARLSLAAAARIADAALERFPEAPAAAALTALAREVEAAPRLVLTVRPEHETRMREAAEHAAAAAGYAGRLVVKAEAGLPRAAFLYDWGDGRAAFDPAAAEARIAQALDAALAAEGLHAEPLLPLEPLS